MYVQAGVSARCGQILRLRAGKGMRVARERRREKGRRKGHGQVLRQRGKLFSQRAAGGGQKAARTDGSFNVCGRRSSSRGSGGVQMFAAE